VSFIRALCSIFVPPVAVLLVDGPGRRFALNLVLTALGFVPGVVHAIWVLTSKHSEQ
jgi:uncharacterized membrane protein YqaE (UPF0057 family)